MKGFFSYTREKDTFQEMSDFFERLRVEVRLRAPGAEIFRDVSSLAPGQNFSEQIINHIKHADVLIVILSPAWLKSEWCRKEFDLFTSEAKDKERLKRVLPVYWVDTPTLKTARPDHIAEAL
jgi:cobaltochelatase CobT